MLALFFVMNKELFRSVSKIDVHKGKYYWNIWKYALFTGKHGFSTPKYHQNSSHYAKIINFSKEISKGASPP